MNVTYASSFSLTCQFLRALDGRRGLDTRRSWDCQWAADGFKWNDINHRWQRRRRRWRWTGSRRGARRGEWRKLRGTWGAMEVFVSFFKPSETQGRCYPFSRVLFFRPTHTSPSIRRPSCWPPALGNVTWPLTTCQTPSNSKFDVTEQTFRDSTLSVAKLTSFKQCCIWIFLPPPTGGCIYQSVGQSSEQIWVNADQDQMLKCQSCSGTIGICLLTQRSRVVFSFTLEIKKKMTKK